MLKISLKTYNRLLSVFLVLGLIGGYYAHAEEAESSGAIREEIEFKRLRFGLIPEVTQVTINGVNLMGYGAGAYAIHALSDSWALSGGLRQSFTLTGGLGALFTEFNFRLVYAITGSLLVQRTSLFHSGERVYQATDYTRGGIRAQLSANQYLFNGSQNVVPFSGIGFAVSYELPSRNQYSFTFGAKYDLLSNGKLLLTPIQIFGGVLFWL